MGLDVGFKKKTNDFKVGMNNTYNHLDGRRAGHHDLWAGMVCQPIWDTNEAYGYNSMDDCLADRMVQ